MGKSASTVRFAAVGDIHVTKDSAGTLRSFFAKASEAADVAAAVRRPHRLRHGRRGAGAGGGAGAVSIPIVAVLGNHDYESGTPEVVADA
jgi:DNA repair exonuclease SbcCD nuclease subunit